MSQTPSGGRSPFPAIVEVRESTSGEAAPPPEGEARPSARQDWAMRRQAVLQFSRSGQWDEVLKTLTFMSSSPRHSGIYQALGHRVWVALKTQAPASDTVLALFHLLNTLGPRHEIAGPVAALAHFVARHRTPDHPDRELAMGQAQQMFALVCGAINVLPGEPFDRWVRETHLDDPNHYVPVVLRALELMVGEEWWFDREALERQLQEGGAS
ncbi:MAG: hypothetical protein HQL59_04530 [Magnetococcales bacterium]|nr:hypothetical protein [Magnetococcales bacterium]